MKYTKPFSLKRIVSWNTDSIIFGIILLLGLGIRLWLIGIRWITPDEGAHLYDAVFAGEGKIPMVDYESRQPLYIYLLTICLKIFGQSYVAGRVLPLLSSIGVGWLIYLISAHLFDRKVGLIAASLFLFLPISVMFTTVVQMEAVVMFFSCLSIYLAVSHDESGRFWPCLFVGVSTAMAYFIRESALALLLVIFLYYLLALRRNLTELARRFGVVLLGFVFVCLVVMLFYNHYLDLTTYFNSSLNPTHLPLQMLRKILSSNSDVFRTSSQPLGSSFRNFVHVLRLNAFLYVGILGFVWIHLSRRRAGNEFGHTSVYLLYSWLISLSLAYLYYFFRRGFYPAYFLELLPPLTISLAAFLTSTWSLIHLAKKYRRRLIIAGTCIVLLVPMQRFFSGGSAGLFYVAVMVSLILVYISLPQGFKKLKKFIFIFCSSFVGISFLRMFILRQLFEIYGSPSFLLSFLIDLSLISAVIAILAHLLFGREVISTQKISFIFLSLLIFSFLSAESFTFSEIDATYNSIWSPKTVQEVSNYIRLGSDDREEILSGAVIWSVEGRRRPFMSITHPLNFINEMSHDDRQAIKDQIDVNPPEYIIMDGYTEKTYFKQLPDLFAILALKYQLLGTRIGSDYPVKIYRLKRDTLS